MRMAERNGFESTKARMSWLLFGLFVIFPATIGSAQQYQINPLTFVDSPGFSVTTSGTITVTNGVISGWNLTVASFETLAHYTKGNTVAQLSKVSVTNDQQSLKVATSPNPQLFDGGQLRFRSPNIFANFSATPADFTGPYADGGIASFVAGSAFDLLSLNQPPNSSYTVGMLNPNSPNMYDLIGWHFPITSTDETFMWGTVKTDGKTGSLTSANILDWDIYVQLATYDVFTEANSTLLASEIGFGSNNSILTVNNPDGELTFVKGNSGGHLYGLRLADFTFQAPPGGRAGYYRGSFGYYEIDLNAPFGPWVVGTSAIPEPETASWWYFAFGIGSMIGTRRSRKRVGGATTIRST